MMNLRIRHLAAGILVGVLLWPALAPAQETSSRLVFRRDGIYGADEMD